MKNRAPAMTTEQFIGLLDELVLVACGSRQKKRGTVVYTLTLEDILEGSAIINRGEIRSGKTTEEVSKESRHLDGPVDCRPIPVARSREFG